MKIYSFWSADTTYYTKFKGLKRAQAVGKDNMKTYLETCEYLEEQPEADKNHFIPEEVEEVEKEWFSYSMKTDPDTMILDDELEALL